MKAKGADISGKIAANEGSVGGWTNKDGKLMATGSVYLNPGMEEVNRVMSHHVGISTIPEATISAIKSVPDVQTVLIGGRDRGINYDVLIRFIKENDQYKFICMYDSGKRIYDAVGECAQCHYVPDLELAVSEAKQITESGKSCVLSPAAASYGYFKNFEERGEVFKQYVLR